MFCSNCGVKNSENAAFCGNCGAKAGGASVQPVPLVQGQSQVNPAPAQSGQPAPMRPYGWYRPR